ncbi:MAG: hypothetical protein ACREUK_01035, partial [Burkholderiales bacterium]
YLDRIVTLRRIAQHTGVPLRRLQDWAALGRLALFAMLAAALAWALVGRCFGAGGPLLRLAAGGTAFACAYAALMASFNPGREWLAAWRARRRQH